MRKTLACGLFLLGTLAMTPPRPARGQSEAPIAPQSAEPAPPLRQDALLRAGQVVTLRVRQVIPRDGFSPADRVLSGLPALAAGDRVLAEVLAPGTTPPALVGGTVAQVVPPGHFGRPGKVTLELGQLVTRNTGESAVVPWRFDLEDRRFNVQMRRKVLLALFAAEGAGAGASVGSNLGALNNPTFIGGGAGVGLLAGLGYASLMPGRPALLEPGDTFQVTVGTLSYRPVPPSPPLKLYPAADPYRKKGAHRP